LKDQELLCVSLRVKTWLCPKTIFLLQSKWKWRFKECFP